MSIQQNAPPEYDNRCFTKFIEAETIVYQFEEDLASLGISVARGSDLETIFLNIMDLYAKLQVLCVWWGRVGPRQLLGMK
jgi:hypothetical protein